MSVAPAPIGLGLMCKPPRPGTSKTRLAACIGAEVAAKLSAAFLSDCAQAALAAARETPLAVTAFFRPADSGSEIADILGPGWQLTFADAGSLGATMRVALCHLLAVCPDGAIIMGADVPLIGADVIGRAVRTLRDGSAHRVVIAPSADGGYCLIGVRSLAAAAPLFDEMAWSTPQVLAVTLQRARAAGLDVTLLEMQRDIDEVQDLHWLRSAIGAQPDRAVATRRVLADLEWPLPFA